MALPQSTEVDFAATESPPAGGFNPSDLRPIPPEPHQSLSPPTLITCLPPTHRIRSARRPKPSHADWPTPDVRAIVTRHEPATRDRHPTETADCLATQR